MLFWNNKENNTGSLTKKKAVKIKCILPGGLFFKLGNERNNVIVVSENSCIVGYYEDRTPPYKKVLGTNFVFKKPWFL